jgi:hypothetical protein
MGRSPGPLQRRRPVPAETVVHRQVDVVAIALRRAAAYSLLHSIETHLRRSRATGESLAPHECGFAALARPQQNYGRELPGEGFQCRIDAAAGGIHQRLVLPYPAGVCTTVSDILAASSKRS